VRNEEGISEDKVFIEDSDSQWGTCQEIEEEPPEFGFEIFIFDKSEIVKSDLHWFEEKVAPR
jgi:hypothetical protein